MGPQGGQSAGEEGCSVGPLWPPGRTQGHRMEGWPLLAEHGAPSVPRRDPQLRVVMAQLCLRSVLERMQEAQPPFLEAPCPPSCGGVWSRASSNSKSSQLPSPCLSLSLPGAPCFPEVALHGWGRVRAGGGGGRPGPALPEQTPGSQSSRSPRPWRIGWRRRAQRINIDAP